VKKRIILHAGMSKCGSSALQAQLSRDRAWLNGHGIAVLREAFDPTTPFNSFQGVNDWSILLPEEQAAGSTSLTRFYEQYKIYRRRKDRRNATRILARLSARTADALDQYQTVILSAEAFETSLSLRDPLFLALLRNLETLAELSVTTYIPTPAEHVASSWQEWGWRDPFLMSEWISLYTVSGTA
jgi:hypothetical protein